MKKQISIGCDPEMFFQTSEGVLVNCIPLIKGTKYQPLPVEEGAIQHDNIAGEFNIDPAVSAEEFSGRVMKVRNTLHEAVNKVEGVWINPVYASTVKLTKEQIKAFGKKCQEFGCDPDFCAYDESPEPHRPMRRTSLFRYAGGHVHIGFDTESKSRQEVVRLCDVFLGIPSLLMDSDNKRRKVYGQAGKYRPKHYGVEYRSLSNFWIHSHDTCEWVFEQAKLAAMAKEEPFINIFRCNGFPSPQEIINHNMKKEAKLVVRELGITMP